ncbi:MAG: hormogonium polysaccharide biosynthesis glycosyltransferase HpsN [Microcoleus vaginatus WJT46-NPBG5]|jgi:glycosyltransferase involved in cell wall biosynthesis|nr:hormogonium polysaccharide biosynthesis glycosyltransferase HpsN [Microcoleus vaginatus WJT46-NPBG5]
MQAVNEPLISVIVPTYGREEPLRQTLVDVLQQDYSNFEVLVVDQTANHEAETQLFLEQLFSAGQIQWFRVNWASLPAARNYGVRRASGEIIVFIDDDVRLPAGFLAAHRRTYQKASIGAVAGRVFDRMKLTDSGGDLTIEYLPPEAKDPGIAWYYIDLVHTVKPQPVISARGCNMSFRRQVFTEFDLRFDERFKGSAVREESDFCLQFRKTGYEIWYEPEAHLIHLGEETGGCHDISTRSAQYQINLYHNHFLMGFKNLTPSQCLKFFARLFDCQVLGHPPCNKSGSLIKTLGRAGFYTLGFLKAFATVVQSAWDDGQIYSRQDSM